MTTEADADARVPQLRRQAGLAQPNALEQPSQEDALELKPLVEGFRGDSDGADAGTGFAGQAGAVTAASDETRKRSAGQSEAAEYDEDEDDEEDDEEEDGEEGEGDGGQAEHGGRGGGSAPHSRHRADVQVRTAMWLPHDTGYVIPRTSLPAPGPGDWADILVRTAMWLPQDTSSVMLRTSLSALG